MASKTQDNGAHYLFFSAFNIAEEKFPQTGLSSGQFLGKNCRLLRLHQRGVLRGDGVGQLVERLQVLLARKSLAHHGSQHLDL